MQSLIISIPNENYISISFLFKHKTDTSLEHTKALLLIEFTKNVKLLDSPSKQRSIHSASHHKKPTNAQGIPCGRLSLNGQLLFENLKKYELRRDISFFNRNSH